MGITPACAGKTTDATGADLKLEDHPRMRGEDFLPLQFALLFAGSPPHARGRPFRRLSPQHVDRITPACAGKTDGRGIRETPRADHPRMRGEDS